MAKSSAPISFTYEDYKNLPESEHERYELLEGELVMVPAPMPYHQQVSRNLEWRLWEFVRDRNLGEVLDAPCDVVLGEPGDEAVVQPDLLFIAADRTSIIGHDAIHGAPDLIVEVLSPSTAERDRTYKRTLYARHGVTEYWLVDPDAQTVEVLTLQEQGYVGDERYKADATLASPLLPGLGIPSVEVF